MTPIDFAAVFQALGAETILAVTALVVLSLDLFSLREAEPASP